MQIKNLFKINGKTISFNFYLWQAQFSLCQKQCMAGQYRQTLSRERPRLWAVPAGAGQFKSNSDEQVFPRWQYL